MVPITKIDKSNRAGEEAFLPLVAKRHLCYGNHVNLQLKVLEGSVSHFSSLCDVLKLFYFFITYLS